MEKNNYEDRYYQRKACEECVEHFKEKQSVLLVMPTGTGKTKVAFDICHDLLDKKIIEHVYWFAHRLELINQAQACCKKMRLPEKDFTFEMRNKIYHFLVSIKEKGKKALVVYDEAHHCTADTYYFKEIKALDARILGLTATPFRTDTGNTFARNFDEVVETINLSTAIEKDFLINFLIKTPADDELKQYRKILKEKILKDYYQSCAEHNFKFDYYQALCLHIAELIKHRPENSKSLIFCSSQNFGVILKHLKDVGKNQFRCEGIRTGYNSSCDERMKLIENFNSHEKDAIDVLVNISILTEGFDSPDVSQIFLLNDTNSHIRMTQIIGRGLRKPTGADFNECQIYSYFATDVLNKIYTGSENNIYIGSENDIDIAVDSAVNLTAGKSIWKGVIPFSLGTVQEHEREHEKIAFDSKTVSAFLDGIRNGEFQWEDLQIKGVLHTPDCDYLITNQHIAHVNQCIKAGKETISVSGLPVNAIRFINKQREEQKRLSDNTDFWDFLRRSAFYCPLKNWGLSEEQEETLTKEMQEYSKNLDKLFLDEVKAIQDGTKEINDETTAGELTERVCRNHELSESERDLLEHMFASYILCRFWEKYEQGKDIEEKESMLSRFLNQDETKKTIIKNFNGMMKSIKDYLVGEKRYCMLFSPKEETDYTTLKQEKQKKQVAYANAWRLLYNDGQLHHNTIWLICTTYKKNCWRPIERRNSRAEDIYENYPYLKASFRFEFYETIRSLMNFEYKTRIKENDRFPLENCPDDIGYLKNSDFISAVMKCVLLFISDFCENRSTPIDNEPRNNWFANWFSENIITEEDIFFDGEKAAEKFIYYMKQRAEYDTRKKAVDLEKQFSQLKENQAEFSIKSLEKLFENIDDITILKTKFPDFWEIFHEN